MLVHLIICYNSRETTKRRKPMAITVRDWIDVYLKVVYGNVSFEKEIRYFTSWLWNDRYFWLPYNSRTTHQLMVLPQTPPTIVTKVLRKMGSAGTPVHHRAGSRGSRRNASIAAEEKQLLFSAEIPLVDCSGELSLPSPCGKKPVHGVLMTSMVWGS